MLPMINIYAQPAAPVAAPSAFGQSPLTESPSGSFKGLLSAKTRAQDDSGSSSAQQGGVSKPATGNAAEIHKPQRASVNSADGTQPAPTVAVPAQAPSASSSTRPQAQFSQSSKPVGGASSLSAGDATGSQSAADLQSALRSILALPIANGASPTADAAATVGTATALATETAAATTRGTESSNSQTASLGDASSRSPSQSRQADDLSTSNAAGGARQEPQTGAAVAGTKLQASEILATHIADSSAKPEEMNVGASAAAASAGTSMTSSSTILPPPKLDAGNSTGRSTVAVPQSVQQMQAPDVHKAAAGGETSAVRAPNGVDLRILSDSPVTAATDSPTSTTGSAHANLPGSATIGAKAVTAATQPPNSNHIGAGAQNGDPKNSNPDSAAAAKTAGLAQASVAGPLHAPADAPPQAPAPAGPAAAEATTLAGTPSGNASVAIAGRPTPLPATAPSSLNDVVQASQLYQHVGGAEMHIAMSTDLLGSVDVHAVVRQSTISATIGVQRPDVQSLLSNDLPALQHALAERSLHVEQISVLSGSTGNQMDLGRQASQNQQNGRGSFGTSRIAGYEVDSPTTQFSPATSAPAVFAEGRLSIHA